MAKRKLKGVADATRASLSQVEVVESEERELYAHVRAYIASARETVYAVANSAMVEAYWNVGREIVEKQGGSGRAAYGDGLIDRIAAKLTAEFGPGYTRSNLRTMRQFYLMFPICHAVSGKLTWTHYRTLITIENEAARQYYFEEAIKSKWSVRDLQRQISTQFYQRLIANHSDLSTAGKLVKRGKVEARDIVRSPAILEFAGISPAEYKEKDLPI